MSLVLTTGVIVGGLKILGKVIDQKINEWNSQTKPSGSGDEQIGASICESTLADNGLYITLKKGLVKIGTVRPRGDGWCATPCFGCTVSDDTYFEMVRVSVEGEYIDVNKNAPVVFVQKRNVPVVVKYNVFGDGTLYCVQKKQ